MNVNEMTAAECADRCAKGDGWNYEPAKVDDLGAVSHCWWKYTIDAAHGERTYASVHPYPLTLDGAAAALPEGLYVSVNHFCDSIRTDVDLWEAATVKNGAYIAGTGPDELTARYRLAVACRMPDGTEQVCAVKEAGQ